MQAYALVSSRRLTGPNLFSPYPGAVIDVELDDSTASGEPLIELSQLAACWARHVTDLLTQIGWTSQQHFIRLYQNGASLAITASIDALYAATEVAELAWQMTDAQLQQPQHKAECSLGDAVLLLKQRITEEANPALIELAQLAQHRELEFLFDDDIASLGSGSGCTQWPVDDIDLDQAKAASVSSIPRGLITGTNGKSTCVRLAGAVMQCAGLTPGVTSTDYIRVGEDIIDHGDYSGPGGARTLLRDERTEIALLEVARGGMLRRGLGVNHAQAALITNVAADHLGDYGINSVPELIEAKFIVRRALTANAPIILNADDAGVVAYTQKTHLHETQPIIWFSEHLANPVLVQHLANGGRGVSISDHQIVCLDGALSGDALTTSIVAVDKVPITLNGAARHNVQNALGVTGLCWALGIESKAIARGLRAFTSSAQDNPGRGNFFDAGGIKILIDYAHNEHGMLAISNSIAKLPSQRRLVMMSQAGDRSDAAIAELVAAALHAKPDQIIVSEIPGYERGRALGETAEVIRAAFIDKGVNSAQIEMVADPLQGIAAALSWARPGDLLLLVVLTYRDESLALVNQFIAEQS